LNDVTESRRIARARRLDRVAAWAITLGGGFVVAAIIGIFVEMFVVAWPLFRPVAAGESQRFATGRPAADWLSLAVDDYATASVLLARDGAVWAIPFDGSAPVSHPVPGVVADAPTLLTASTDGRAFHAWAADGSFVRIPLRFSAGWNEADGQTVSFAVGEPAFVDGLAGRAFEHRVSAVDTSTGRTALAGVGRDGAITLFVQERRENLFGDVEESASLVTIPADGAVRALAMDAAAKHIYVARVDDSLERWAVGDADEAPQRLDAVEGAGQIAALGFVLGDTSLLVGDQRGGQSVWFPVREDGEGERYLRRIRELPDAGAAVKSWQRSGRDRTVAALTVDGRVVFDHATSARRLLELRPQDPLLIGALNARGNAYAGLSSNGDLHVWGIDNPHPEISLTTLFGRIWYEGYDGPAWVWQSTAATTEFEPKLSLVPLMFGTAKATFYALLLSLPLAILAAIYASQFMGPRTRRIVKPAVEIMAAFPTVVIGFLAALWLAPRLEHNLVGFYLTLGLVPIVTALWLWLWETRLRTPARMRRLGGFEWLLVVPVLAVGVLLALQLGPLVEQALFAGDIRNWLFSELGTRYDQRNSIAIAIALGFAVVPIIFTISDDAMSNVPRSLTAASLAVGATRWQTVWKVVLPSASPGIFAALMIGFGRAVGETMIVLMATGNTPIMDWSWFNGMRTLSANIAVEIPEAPHGGSLYRVLFLSAVLLFAVTFVANTLAEIVRSRLRSRYGRF
jgi:phosphate transport system permease protein